MKNFPEVSSRAQVESGMFLVMRNCVSQPRQTTHVVVILNWLRVL